MVKDLSTRLARHFNINTTKKLVTRLVVVYLSDVRDSGTISMHV